MLSNYTKDQIQTMLTVLRECGGNYHQASKRCVVPERIIRAVDIIGNKKYNFTEEGRGPVHMQRYIVATRGVMDRQGWNNSDEKIVSARKLYDAGKIELVTGRDGLNLILYAIPRREKIVRKPYFTEVNNVVSMVG